MFKTRIYKILSLFAIVFISLSILTCSPGLGSVVDTRAPSIAVTSPSTKSVISGQFTMSGSASDETSVSSVKVEFFKIGNTTASYSYNATLSGTSWKLVLNKSVNGTYPIVDGDYNITVTARDSGGHTTSSDVVYTIDNTKPTVLLTSPTTYATTPEMAKTFSIKGEVYDATTISNVTVYIVDKDGNVKASKTAEGTNTFIATFNSPDLEDYDGTENTMYYYYAVASDQGGNKNSYDYHISDIYTLMASYEGATFPSINDLGYLDQGLKTSLDSGLTAIRLSGKRLYPDPDDNTEGFAETKYPDFIYYSTEQSKIQWLNISSKSTGQYDTLGVGGSVLGMINPTTNGSTPNNFKIWVMSLTEEGGVPQYQGHNIESEGSEIRWTTSSTEKDNYQVYFTPTGSAYSFEIKSKDPSDDGATNWTSGYWWVKVWYETNSGDTGEDDAIFVVSAEVPAIDETAFAGSSSPSYYRGFMTAENKENGTNKIAGNATRADGSTISTAGNGGSLRISYVDENEETKYIDLDSTSSTYSYTFDYATDGSDDSEIQYTIMAVDGDKISTLWRVVVIDTVAPVLDSSNLEDGDIISSSTLKYQGVATDANGIASF
ncbi:MAG: hypothetical protein K5839_04345, partial [Treponemataceae bacterium]|nr:hypothetical protein [Treponemataceae bacterium]